MDYEKKIQNKIQTVLDENIKLINNKTKSTLNSSDKSNKSYWESL